MKEIRISEDITYLPASEEPLSSDVGIIRNGSDIWLFDVGADERAAEYLDGEYMAVISHFHQDHTANHGRIRIRESYVSRMTRKHIHDGNIVEEDVYDGDIHIFPIPSGHAKGCLGLETGDYAFVGDAVYGKERDDCREYNVQLLKAQIDVLKGLNAGWLLVSHYPGMKRDRLEVISELENIYAEREKNNPVILIRMGR